MKQNTKTDKETVRVTSEYKEARNCLEKYIYFVQLSPFVTATFPAIVICVHVCVWTLQKWQCNEATLQKYQFPWLFNLFTAIYIVRK